MTDPTKAVFLSYASQDAEAARRICESLQAAGIEVWFDQSELRGGEAWDRQIRKQINVCALFIPIISAHSQSRLEGYFRREWKLAADRTHDMAEEKAFLVPVVIDDTSERHASVPDKFRDLQWTHLPAGETSRAFIERVSRLLTRDPVAAQSPAVASVPRIGADSKAPAHRYEGAAAFAKDCQRSLRGEKAEALSDRLGYRLSKFVSRHRRILAMSVAAALVAGILGYIVLTPGSFGLHGPLLQRTSKASATVPSSTSAPALPTNSSLPAPSKRRIAILPFENLSPDPNNAFFADGMHEEILTSLANASPDLEVISRTTMDSYKDKPVTVAQLAKDLGCTDVLEGSVRRQGNEVRVSLQLINAKDDSHIWAQDYDNKLVSAMALQTQIATEVASQLSVRLAGRASPESSPTTRNPLAYDIYLKGRVALQELSALSSLQNWRQAQSYYDQLIKLDPGFASAYVDRIFIRTQLLLNSLDASDENLSAAERDLATLRKLAPDDSRTAFAEGVIAYAEIHYAQALQLFETAERNGDSDPALLGAKSALLFNMGRFEESEQIDRKLAALDPGNSTREYNWWFSLMELKRPQEAISVANLGVQRWAGNAQLLSFWRGWRNATLFYFSTVRLPEITLPPPSADDLSISDLLRYGNRNEEAREYIDASKAKVYHADIYWRVKRGDQIPVADLRGWFDLFLNDKAAARRDGQLVLDFLAETPAPRWNKWLRPLLRADAALFVGDNGAAVRHIEESVALADATEDKSDQTNAKMWRAMIYAWAGRKDEAAQLLEGFATSIPGLWPAEVVYNPGWNIALKENPRYRALRARLIAQMTATKLE